MSRGWLQGGMVAVGLGVVSCATCAPQQRVPIDSAPRDAEVFVDGKLAGTSPLELDLRADQDHSIFVKRRGYRPELVILRSTDGKPRPALDPGEVRIRLVPLHHGRDLQVEVDPESSDPVPLDPNWQRSR